MNQGNLRNEWNYLFPIRFAKTHYFLLLQGMTTSGTTSVRVGKKIILGFKMKQNANLVPEQFCSFFYGIYNYYVFICSI